MSDNIKVTVRVRPFIKREVADGTQLSHWDIHEENTLVHVNPTSRKPLGAPFVFDGVFSPEVQNEEVYQEVARPIIESALSGFNGTIFVYGQTSSGKTFTMMGDNSSPGVVPLAVQNIFRSIEYTPDREYLIRASYMEIYNENISDLLAGRESKGRSLNVREDLSGAVYVADLREECANCEDQLLSIIKRGEKNRHIASTSMNERSSRSHTIFRLILESRERGDEGGEEGAVTVSHLNLVDLAGSENVSQTGATGERLREGGFINKSLFMLGRVISQLSEGEQFVNFRDSKLTRILQPSLGGNSKTAIICTVTPAAVEQTYSSLRFASRAKAIKNKPIVNEVLSEAALLKRYAREIKTLQHSLALERNTDKAQEVEQVREMLGEQARRNEELEAKIHELKTKLVVSSMPRGSERPVDKKRKARRETWCAPAMRGSRVSLGTSLLVPSLPPCVQEHEFIQPKLPPWTELSIDSNSSALSDTSVMDIDQSISQEEFGKEDVSFLFNQAEKSKLKSLDSSFPPSPGLVNTDKRKKRVKFAISPSPMPLVSEVACQTEDTLMPQMRLLTPVKPTTPGSTLSSPQLPATPCTPAAVLRARNLELKQRLKEKEEWLNDWRYEIDTLREYQRLEIKAMEESFEGRVAAINENGATVQPSVESIEHHKEITSLKKSLQDYEQLLLDANRELSLNINNSADLQRRLEALSEENIHLSSLQEEVEKLHAENEKLKKDLEAKDDKVKQCENERTDFDMMMELALEKQMKKEQYLRKSLEEAWKDLAAYEKGKEVKERSPSHLDALDELTKQRVSSGVQSSDDLKSKFEEAQHEAERLRTQLMEVSEEMERKTIEAEELRQEVKDLQEYVSQLVSEQGSDRIQGLHEQVDLKGRLERTEKTRQMMEEEEKEGLISPTESVSERRGGGEGSTAPSQDFSRVLSETIQALEESICMSTPGRHSFGSYLDGLSFHDLEAARPMVETLKSGLTALQEHIQVMEQQQEEAAHTTQHCIQMTAEMERETNTWNTQESLIGDYILYSSSLYQPDHHNSHKLHTPSHTNEAVSKAVEEACTVLKAEYEAKMKEQLMAIETRARLNSTKTETLYLSFSQESDPPSGINKQEDTLSGASFLSFGSHSRTMEVEELRDQLELLTQENNELLDQVRELQGITDPVTVVAVGGKTASTSSDIMNVCDRPEEKPQISDQDNVTSEIEACEEFDDEEVEDQKFHTPPHTTSVSFSWDEGKIEATSPECKQCSQAPQSLADELREAGMKSLLNETFETSVFMPASVPSPNRDLVELRQQLAALEQEKTELQEMVQSLQDSLKEVKEGLVSSEESNTEKELKTDQLESKEEKLEECQSQETDVRLKNEPDSRDPSDMNQTKVSESQDMTAKDEILRLEAKVKELEEELNCKNIQEEEKVILQDKFKDQSNKNQTKVSESQDMTAKEEISRLEAKVKELEEELSYKNIVQEEIKKLEEEKLILQDKLNCMNLIEEEVCSLQWQVTSLKEEKTDLEKELVFMQSEMDELTQQTETTSIENKCDVQVEGSNCEEIKLNEANEMPSPNSKDECNLQQMDELTQRTESTSIESKCDIQVEGLNREEIKSNEANEMPSPNSKDECDLQQNTTEELKPKGTSEITSLNHHYIHDEESKNACDLQQKTKELQKPKEEIKQEGTIDIPSPNHHYQVHNEGRNDTCDLEQKTTELQKPKEEIKQEETNEMPSPNYHYSIHNEGCNDTCNLEQKTKELQQAKEEIETLKQEIQKLRSASEQINAEVKSEACTSEPNKRDNELEEARNKIELLTREIEKALENYQEELAQKESDLEMIITNFTDKEEAFERTEKELERVLAELEQVKKALEDKDLELHCLKKHSEEEMKDAVINPKQQEEYTKVTSELTELKEVLVNKDQELEKVTSRLEEMKAAILNPNLQEEYMKLTSELTELKEVLVSKDEELEKVTLRLEERKAEEETKASIFNQDKNQEEYRKLKSELTELKEALVTKDQELEKVTLRLEEMKAAILNPNLQEEYTKVTSELTELQEALVRKDEELEKMTLRSEEMKAKEMNTAIFNPNLQEEYAKLTSGVTELKEALVNKDEELEKVTSRLEEMKAEETNSAILNPNLQEEYMKVTSELTELKEVLVNKDQELEKVTLRLEEMEKEETNTAILNPNLQEECTKVTSELTELKEVLINKDQELEKVTSRLEEMKAEVKLMVNQQVFSDLEESFNKLQQAYDDLQSKSENQLLEIQASARQLKEKYDRCFQDYTNAAKACEENRLMLVKAEEERESLRIKLEREVQKHEDEKENLRTNYDHKLQKAESDLILRHESELQKCDEEKENMKMKYECEARKHEEERERLKQKYEHELLSIMESQTKEDLDVSVQHIMEQKLEDLEVLKDHLEEKKKECGQLRDTIENLKTVLTKKQEDLRKLSMEHQDELTFYKDSLNEKEKDLKNLENETKRKSEEVNSLSSSLGAKDHQLHRLERDLNTNQQKLRDRETELQEVLNSAENEASRRIREIQEDLNRQKKDYEEVCADRKELSQAFGILKEANENLTHECSNLRTQLANLKEDFLQIEKDFEAGKNVIKMKQNTIHTLEAEQEKLKEELERQREKEKNTIHTFEAEQKRLKEELEYLSEKEKNTVYTLQAEQEKLKEELECLREKEKNAIHTLEAEQKLKQELECLREKETALIEQHVIQSKAVEDLTEEIEKYRCYLLDKEQQMLDMTKNLVSKTKNEEKLVKQLANVYSQLEDKCKGEEEARVRYEVLTDELQNYKVKAERIDELMANLSTAEEKINTLEKEQEERLHNDTSMLVNQSQHAQKPQENEPVSVNIRCKDCGHFKSMIERLNTLMKENEAKHERKVAELTLIHNTSVNASLLSTSLTNTGGPATRRSKIEKMEHENDKLRLQLSTYSLEIKELQDSLEMLRRTNGVISEDKEVQRELNWMWEKMEDAENKLEILNRNYDLLERDHEKLKKSQMQRLERRSVREASESVAVLEMQKYVSLQDDYKTIEKKHRHLLEEHERLQERLKCIDGLNVSQEEHTKLQEKYKTLQEKYCTLEESYSTLQDTYGTMQQNYRTLQEIHNTVQEDHNALQENYSALEDKYVDAKDGLEKLQDRNNHLLSTQSRESTNNFDTRKQTETRNTTRESSVAGEMPVPHTETAELREQFTATVRENNELKLRMKAMDAPLKKKIESLTKELENAERKISYLKGELRRQQEVSRGDSTICELTGQSSLPHERGTVISEASSLSGSSAVAQIVVLELENKLYHAEKDKKKMESEVTSLQQHVDHYLSKAKEWKEKALKEEQAKEKTKKDLNEAYTELRKYMSKAEELYTMLERQQFELGHQREVIQKMEKERQDKIDQPSCTPLASSLHSSGEVTPASGTMSGTRDQTSAARGTTVRPTPTNTAEVTAKETRKPATSDTDAAEDTQKQSVEERQTNRLLGMHNAPLPSRTRVEKLPFRRDIQARGTKEEVPMWKSLKENKDYSKYKLPPNANKQGDNCQTQ